ncbi:MAG: WhiB family transcriptional regulator, partial [Pseudonocardiaceae bacterium]
MAGQDITANVMEIDERFSCSGRRTPPLETWHTGYRRGQRPACWKVDPEMFYGPADSVAGRSLYAWERRALAVCAACPVAAASLAEALEFPADDQYG